MAQVSDITRFIREVRGEIGRITWPSFASTRQMTIMVLILVTLIGLFLFATDLIIAAGLKALLGL